MNDNAETRKDAPIYKQLADEILRSIKTGKLPAGSRLPTVRELAEEKNLSQGTIKHAYDYLESLGIIEMTQGKGTFVRAQEEADSASRKDRAMSAIDGLFRELETLGFTPREMEIYIDLKLRGLEEKYDVVKVAVIDCNPETLQLIENQLSQIGYAQIAIFSLSQLYEIADKLNADYDLVLTTSTHYGQVEQVIRDPQSFGMLALMPSTRTVISLAKLPDRARAGIVCASDAFAGVIRKNCAGMGAWSESLPVHFFGSGADRLAAFLEGKNTIILPEQYDPFAGPEEKTLLRNFEEKGGSLITYDYKIERGSFLYAEDLIKKIMNKKRSV